MVTTLIILIALAVSVYINYKREVTLADVLSESKELYEKAIGTFTKKDKKAKEELHKNKE